MAMYMFEASYTKDGVKGLLHEGGTGRRAAIDAMMRKRRARRANDGRRFATGPACLQSRRVRYDWRAGRAARARRRNRLVAPATR